MTSGLPSPFRSAVTARSGPVPTGVVNSVVNLTTALRSSRRSKRSLRNGLSPWFCRRSKCCSLPGAQESLNLFDRLRPLRMCSHPFLTEWKDYGSIIKLHVRIVKQISKSRRASPARGGDVLLSPPVPCGSTRGIRRGMRCSRHRAGGGNRRRQQGRFVLRLRSLRRGGRRRIARHRHLAAQARVQRKQERLKIFAIHLGIV